MKKRKITVTTGARADYGLLRPILNEILSSKNLDLFLIVTGMHLSKKHGNTIDIIKKEIEHKRIVKKEFNRDTVTLYDDIYNSPGLKKYYVVNNVLEDFTSKVGQHIEILDLEQFGKSLFIDNELQVATNDEHLYSSTFVINTLFFLQ